MEGFEAAETVNKASIEADVDTNNPNPKPNLFGLFMYIPLLCFQVVVAVMAVAIAAIDVESDTVRSGTRYCVSA